MLRESTVLIEGLRSVPPMTLRDAGALVLEIALPILVMGRVLAWILPREDPPPVEEVDAPPGAVTAPERSLSPG